MAQLVLGDPSFSLTIQDTPKDIRTPFPERNVTNRAIRSQEFDNAAAWAKDNITVTADDAVAPDRTKTADFLNETTSTSTHSILNGITTITPNSPLTCSVFVKQKLGRDWVRFSYFDSAFGAVGAGVWFNIATGEVGGGIVEAAADYSVLNAAIEKYDDNWWRLILVVKTGANANGSIWIAIAPDGDNSAIENFTGVVGNGILVWGGQMEDNKDFVGRYVATTTAAVTSTFSTVLRSPIAADVDLNSTGVKLSYTVPSDLQAKLLSATGVYGGGQTVALQLVRGASNVTLQSSTTGISFNNLIALLSGDIIQINVTGAAAGNGDFNLSIVERP